MNNDTLETVDTQEIPQEGQVSANALAGAVETIIASASAAIEQKAINQPKVQANRYEPGKTKKHKVKVYRLRVDENNKNLPVTVCVNDISTKREFYPGTIVELDDVQIQSLRDARLEQRVQVPADSGIYEAANPLREAERVYGNGMTAKFDPADGTIWVEKFEDTYLIERLD